MTSTNDITKIQMFTVVFYTLSQKRVPP